jgi:hypothetical protein
MSGSHQNVSGLIKILGNFMRMEAIQSKRDNTDPGKVFRCQEVYPFNL